MQLETARGDLGLPGFPSKDLHWRFLSRFKSALFLRQRSYSKTVNVAPFLLNYDGATFREYPGPWQVMLRADSGELACIAERAERYGLGEAKEMLGPVLSQRGGSLWHLVKRNIAEQEDGEAALAALVEAAKDRPAALLETEAFKAAFQSATGEEMPALEFTPCAGCRSLGCKQCRVAPLPPTEADGSR